MIADQNFYDLCFTFFYPTASATAYGQRPKFFRAEHSATAEGENCAYGPTLSNLHTSMTVSVNINMSKVSDKPIGICNQTPFDSIPEIHYINKIMF